MGREVKVYWDDRSRQNGSYVLESYADGVVTLKSMDGETITATPRQVGEVYDAQDGRCYLFK